METSVRTPLQLWIVGALATLWNAFGAFDYVMTPDPQRSAISPGFTDPQRAYFDSFPIWMEATWAFGVWGGAARRGAAPARAQPPRGDRLRGVARRRSRSATIYQYVLSNRRPTDMMTRVHAGDATSRSGPVAIGLLWLRDADAQGAACCARPAIVESS